MGNRARCAIKWSPMNARGLRHVGILLGIYLAYILYPLFDEWRQRRLDKRRLRKMREHFAKGRRWDVAKGEWIDE